MTKREFLDTVFALAPNEANAIMDAFDEYVESNVVSTGRSGKERRMSKYIIEIPDDVQYVLFNGKADNKCYTAVHPVAELEILNSDYINEHFGELQDEAYQRGLEDGKKSVSEPDRIEVGDEVKAPFGTAVVVCCDYDADKASYIYSSGRHGFDNTWNLKKTGKHYDIASILEAMRTHD